MLEFSDEDFKALMIKMFQQIIMNMLETKGLKASAKKKKRGKCNQMQCLELKNTKTNIKTQGMGSRVEWKEQRKELVNQNTEQQKLYYLNMWGKKKTERNKQSLRGCWTVPKDLIFVSPESQKENRKKVG